MTKQEQERAAYLRPYEEEVIKAARKLVRVERASGLTLNRNLTRVVNGLDLAVAQLAEAERRATNAWGRP